MLVDRQFSWTIVKSLYRSLGNSVNKETKTDMIQIYLTENACFVSMFVKNIISQLKRNNFKIIHNQLLYKQVFINFDFFPPSKQMTTCTIVQQDNTPTTSSRVQQHSFPTISKHTDTEMTIHEQYSQLDVQPTMAFTAQNARALAYSKD